MLEKELDNFKFVKVNILIIRIHGRGKCYEKP